MATALAIPGHLLAAQDESLGYPAADYLDRQTEGGSCGGLRDSDFNLQVEADDDATQETSDGDDFTEDSGLLEELVRMRRVDQLRLGQPERVLLLLIFIFQVLLRARRFSISTSFLRESRISLYFYFRPDDMHTDLVLGMLDQTGETAETTPIVYVPPATDQSDDVRVYLVPMIVRFSFLIRQRAHFGPFFKQDAAMKLKAQVSSLEAALKKAQTHISVALPTSSIELSREEFDLA
ncbi:conserved hypothetical protein, partial [Ricinus communis]